MKSKKKVTPWIQALNIFNQNHAVHVIPKKNTLEYRQVKAVADALKNKKGNGKKMNGHGLIGSLVNLPFLPI